MDGVSTTPAAEAQEAGVTPAEVTPRRPARGGHAGRWRRSVYDARGGHDGRGDAGGDGRSGSRRQRERPGQGAGVGAEGQSGRGAGAGTRWLDRRIAGGGGAGAERLPAGGGGGARGRTETEAGAEAPPEAARPPAVPAGGATNVVDPSTLAPTTKIAQGLLAEGRGLPAQSPEPTAGRGGVVPWR